MIKEIIVCFNKDFKFYFQSKLIYLILPIYAALSAGLTFYASDFLENSTDNMLQFFSFQPMIIAIVASALSMRIWSDEYKYGTLEILLSQPISYVSVVLGKFFALWAMIGLMLISSFGIWVITALLVPLDNFWVVINYLITFLMAGSLCAIALFAAGWFYNSLGAFLISLGVCHLVTSLTFEPLLKKFIPDNIVFSDLLKSFDYQYLFENLVNGQIMFSTLAYFVLLIVTNLILAVYLLDFKRS